MELYIILRLGRSCSFDVKAWYNEQAARVAAFCQAMKIDCYIKKGTVTGAVPELVGEEWRSLRGDQTLHRSEAV